MKFPRTEKIIEAIVWIRLFDVALVLKCWSGRAPRHVRSCLEAAPDYHNTSRNANSVRNLVVMADILVETVGRPYHCSPSQIPSPSLGLQRAIVLPVRARVLQLSRKISDIQIES
jgi:hypothetical protein